MSDYDKLFVVPLPRYLWTPCCRDPEHSQNITEDGYAESQLSDLDACHRLWKGLAHREKIRNVKICNVGKLVSTPSLWDEDPVHPKVEAYAKTARYLVAGAGDMERKRKSMLEEGETSSEAKRPKLSGPSSSADTLGRIRSAWITNSGQFVTPGQPCPFYRGCGQFRGRGYSSAFY
jgi:hypothetical protein